MKSFDMTESLPAHYYFETLIDKEVMRRFFQRYWHLSIYISFIYLLFIYFLRKYMNSRSPFHLRSVAIIWNGILAIFSIICTLRVTPVYYHQLTRNSFYFLVCDKSLVERTPTLVLWGTLFTFSKIWELGDTILIILRKQNLMFLHFYHHVVAVTAIWYATYREVSCGYVFTYVNVAVHSFVYSYFFFKSVGFKIPVRIAMFITTVQTLQMLFGVVLSFWIYWLIVHGFECDTPKDFLYISFLIYLSYLFLFSYLFYNSYIKCHSSKKNS